MTTERIRAFMLKPGDDFIMNGRRYKVIRIVKGVLYYYVLDEFGKYVSRLNTMSAKSKQWVEIVTNKTK
jgi:hypothetical protein